MFFKKKKREEGRSEVMVMVLALFTATVSCVYTLFQTHKNVCIKYVQLFCVSIVPPPRPSPIKRHDLTVEQNG